MVHFRAGSSLEKRNYFPFPKSLDPLSPVLRNGLIPVGILATMSLVSVTALLIFIVYRMILWRRHYREYVGFNQYVIFILNLLIADVLQSLALVTSFHWLRIDKMLAPTMPCQFQGWFLHLGNLANGFFVMAIAIHTWIGVVKGYKLSYRWLVIVILLIWLFSTFLTILGPIMHRKYFYTRAGIWCWISLDFQEERLFLYYLWIW
jgi:hypothetical protein